MQLIPHWSSRVHSVLFTVLLLLTTQAAPAASEAFTEERFKALQAQGALILVDVHADWCPTCTQQQKILDAYEAARPDAALHRLIVDFDKQKEWVKHFKAPRQSTLLLYRGVEQRWFAVAETREKEVFTALDAAAAPTP